MQTSTLTSSSGATAATGSSTDPTLSALTSAGTLGKQDFLNLLVSQLRAQNPLDPVDNEQFVSELAQFSSLEEMQNVADATQTNTNVMGSVNNAVATSFIGRTAIVSSDSLQWQSGDAGKVDVGVDLPTDGSAVLSVYNDSNQRVATFTLDGLGSGINMVGWDGKDDSGNPLPAGSYHMELQAFDTSGAAQSGASAVISGGVQGVSFVNGATYLQVGGTRVPLSSVAEINA